MTYTILYLKHACSPERPFAIWIERPIGKPSFRETRKALFATSNMTLSCPYCHTKHNLREFQLTADPLMEGFAQ
jgi:hypothetical protein